MSDFSKLVDQVAKGKRMDEVSPPGFKGTVKALKKRHKDEVDNPFALAWWMKNKGYKSHKKATGGPKNEGIGSYRLGPGTRVSVVHGSGIDSGKTGTVVDRSEIRTDGRGVPNNVSNNPYKPVDWSEEVAVRLDDGSLITMYKDRLIPERSNESMGTPVSVDGGENSVSTGFGADLTPGDVQDLELGMESIIVDHPTKGRGEVLEINENNIVVDWDNLNLSILGPERMPFSEAKYLFRVDERYSDKESDVEIDGDDESEEESENGVKEDSLANSHVPETNGELSTINASTGSDWTPALQDDPPDSPDVTDFHAPKPGKDGVRSVIDAGVRSEMRSKAHRKDNRRGTRAKVRSNEGKNIMATRKKKLDEHMVAIQGTYRGESPKLDVEDLDLTFDDLLEYDVPEPQDTVLTKGDQVKNEKIPPLSTEAGASAAHDSPYPDGDMADDAPDDAPTTPDYEDIDDGGNERKVDSSGEPSADISGSSKKKTKKSTDSSESAGDSTKDEEKEEMDESILSWEDIGLQLDECGCGGDAGDDGIGMGMNSGRPSMMNMHEDEGEPGGVSMSRELLDRLLRDIRDQQPDDDKLGYICTGIEEAGREKGGELGIEDIGMIMDEIREAFTGQDVDNDGDVGGDELDNEPEDEFGDEYEPDELDSPSSVGNEEEGDGYEFEDKAEGDGEPAGPEGGKEHEGKTKLMDKDEANEATGASGSAGPVGGFGNEKESKKIKPINKNTAKGSGPGGGNTDNYGQSGNIPAVKKGSQRATPGAPLSKEGGGRTVPPVSESKRVDEAMVAVGMSAIGGVMRGDGGPDIDPSDPDAELKMIRRRAGLPNWWKV